MENKLLEVEKKPVEITVTAEEQEMIFTGKRPEGMRFDVFDKVRNDLKRATKLYKGGKYKHLSVWVEDVKDKDGNKIPVRKSNTYVKPKS